MHRLNQPEIPTMRDGSSPLRRRDDDTAAATATDSIGHFVNLSPVGYCTLSKQGVILQANLMAGTLVGLARWQLLGETISRFILQADLVVAMRM